MQEADGQTKQHDNRMKLIVLSIGAGLLLIAGASFSSLFWFKSHPAESWNRTAIIVHPSPGFGVSSDGKEVLLIYTLENASKRDYQITQRSQLLLMYRLEHGVLTPPLSDPGSDLVLPIFIPPGQKEALAFRLKLDDVPARKSQESDAAFHERLRSYLNEREQDIEGFVIFDKANRYEIDLPRWSDKPSVPAAKE